MILSMSDLCSGEGEGLIVEWCLCEPLQDLSCSWPHHTQHSIVRGDVMECDRGREVTGDPGSHVGHMGSRTHCKVPEEGGGRREEGGGRREEGGGRREEGGGRREEGGGRREEGGRRRRRKEEEEEGGRKRREEEEGGGGGRREEGGGGK